MRSTRTLPVNTEGKDDAFTTVAVAFAVLVFSDPRSGPVIEQAAGFLLDLGLTDGMSG